MKKKLLLAGLTFFIIYSCVTAQPGTLDVSFGSGGKIIANNGFPEHNNSNIALQTDGKVVMGGYAEYTGTNGDVVLARFNSNGTLDNTFDGDGIVSTDISGNGYDYVAKVIVLSTGKILVGGYTQSTGTLAFLLRYNSNGTLDNSFDGDGKITINVPDLNYISDMAIQTDNKIVLSGNNSGNSFLLIRFEANGVLDNTFGVNGISSPGLGGDVYSISAMTIQTDNKILILGSMFDPNTYKDKIVIARYNINGILDNGFNSNGKVLIDYFTPDEIDVPTDISLKSNGNILISGFSFGSNGNLPYTFLLGITSIGTTDNSLGPDGKLTISSSTNFISIGSHLIQTDGKIVLSGIYKNSSGNYDFAIMRLTSTGGYDNTFDTDGLASSPVNNFDEMGFDIVIQTDGKILLGGVASLNNTRVASAIVRFSSNGAIDNTFDTDGYNTFNSGNNPGYDEAIVAKLQPDNKIVIAGNYNPNLWGGIFINRYNSDGTPDNSFGNNGRASRILPLDCNISSMQIQSDGKIILVGTQYDLISGVNILLCRFNANGTPDNTFGIGGLVSTDFSGQYDLGLSLALQTDGKIIITAISDNFQFDPTLILCRYNSNGTPDNTFGSSGIVQTGIATPSYNSYYYNTQAVALQNDEKILVIAPRISSNIDFSIKRFNSNGTPDNIFNGGNVLYTDFNNGDDYPYVVLAQPDGKILVAGEAFDGTNSKIAIVRYTSTGGLDNTFDIDGKKILSIANNNRAIGIDLMSDNKIVIGGIYSFYSITNNKELTYMLAARLNGDGTPDNSFGTNGVAIVDNGVTPKSDFANSMALQADGKIILAGSTEINNQLDMAVYRLNGSFPTAVISPSSPLHLIMANPNPVTDKLSIIAEGIPNGRYQYKATTMDGKVITTGFINVNSRRMQQSIPVLSWPNGTVFFSISNNKESKTFKLIKQ